MQQVPGNVAGFPGVQYPMSANGIAPQSSLDAVLQEIHPSAFWGYFAAEHRQLRVPQEAVFCLA